MRILFWSSNFWPEIGGVEVLAAKLLPALQARGYEYAVVTPKSHPDLPDVETYKGIPVHRCSLLEQFESRWNRSYRRDATEE